MLIVDHRERAVVCHLRDRLGENDLRVEQLWASDYAVCNACHQVVALVERKTLSDLSMSIKDGRMENHAKMKHAADRLRPHCPTHQRI